MWLRLSAKVKRGQAAFGVLNGPETDFYMRKVLDASDDFQDVVLEVAHPGESRKLIIENSTPGGAPADLLIRKIELMAKPHTPIWKQLWNLQTAPAR